MTKSKKTSDAEFNDPQTWPHAPVFFCAAPSMKQESKGSLESLPLGEVVPFETDLFHGKILFRIRDLPAADDKDRHDEYFSTRKRRYQVVVQGKFQRDDINFGKLFIGARYDKPFDGIPMRKSRIMKSIQSFIKRLTPGMLFDIAADKPRVMAPMGTCQHLNICREGNEPDILGSSRGIEEDTRLLFEQDGAKDEKPFASSNERRKRLADPSCSSKFKVDPSLVYTFEIYDHTINFANYKQHFGGFMKADLSNKLNGQPLTLTALMVPHDDEDADDRYKNEAVLYDFQVWHEKLLGCEPAKQVEEELDDPSTSTSLKESEVTSEDSVDETQ
jgi:Protein of unknown function (DUF1769)